MEVFRIIVIVSVFGMFSSCFSLEKNYDYIDEIHRISNQIAEEVQKTENLHLIGSGGALKNCVETIALRFQTRDEITEDSGLRWICRIVELMVDKIGSSEKIIPHFCENGFDSKNLSIAIFSLNSKSKTTTLSMDENTISFEYTPPGQYKSQLIKEYDLKNIYNIYQKNKTQSK
jgi:hypothetical protein